LAEHLFGRRIDVVEDLGPLGFYELAVNHNRNSPWSGRSLSLMVTVAPRPICRFGGWSLQSEGSAGAAPAKLDAAGSAFLRGQLAGVGLRFLCTARSLDAVLTAHALAL